MKYKKILIIILSFTIFLCSCTQHPPKTDTSHMRLCLNFSGSIETLNEINDALNEYLAPKIGVQVDLIPYQSYDMLKAALNSKERIDISFCSSLSNIVEFSGEGLLMPLDDLLHDNGNEICEIIPEAFYKMAYIGDSLYALPTNRESAQIIGFEYNRELAQAFELDLANIHSILDLNDVFEDLREKTSDISPIAVVPQFIYYDQVDTLYDSFGVITYDTGNTVVNLYETEQFYQLVQMIRQWYEKGYTFSDTGESSQILYYLTSGKVLGSLTVGKEGFEIQEKNLSGCDIGFVPLGVPYQCTDSQSRAWYIIPANAPDPAASMKLLNLMYSDAYIANLLLYGIEGTNYRLTSEGLVSRIANSGYDGVKSWSYCNCFHAYVPEGLPVSFWKDLEQSRETAICSPALSFVFDSTPVSTQLYRCEQVREEYLNLLYSGVCDPEPLLEKMNAALKEAGIDEIIAEKQRQLDVYMEKR